MADYLQILLSVRKELVEIESSAVCAGNDSDFRHGEADGQRFVCQQIIRHIDDQIAAALAEGER